MEVPKSYAATLLTGLPQKPVKPPRTFNDIVAFKHDLRVHLQISENCGTYFKINDGDRNYYRGRNPNEYSLFKLLQKSGKIDPKYIKYINFYFDQHREEMYYNDIGFVKITSITHWYRYKIFEINDKIVMICCLAEDYHPDDTTTTNYTFFM